MFIVFPDSVFHASALAIRWVTILVIMVGWSGLDVTAPSMYRGSSGAVADARDKGISDASNALTKEITLITDLSGEVQTIRDDFARILNELGGFVVDGWVVGKGESSEGK
eukprot:GHVU01145364.1.p2 GENE.GHVU01145364.1~~GHVU01145364.1.p2  ORF type:complete len:110 (-),score=9.97 GHVU01145364.1:527-856(-)